MKLVFKGSILLFLSLILIPYAIKAQDWEYGVSVGTSGYMGEYNPDDIFKFNSVSGSVGVKYNFNPTWGVKANVSGIDVKWVDEQSVNNKTIGEFSIVSEFNFFKFEPNRTKTAYTPYVFAGMGGRLDHVDSKKILKRAVAPFGAGFKYNLKSTLSMVAELAYRITADDKLDNNAGALSQKDNFFDRINNRDSYMTFQLGLTYTFFKQGCPTW